jgi:hypothetical protein
MRGNAGVFTFNESGTSGHLPQAVRRLIRGNGDDPLNHGSYSPVQNPTTAMAEAFQQVAIRLYSTRPLSLRHRPVSMCNQRKHDTLLR